jgi:hypothetical protein
LAYNNAHNLSIGLLFYLFLSQTNIVEFYQISFNCYSSSMAKADASSASSEISRTWTAVLSDGRPRQYKYDKSAAGRKRWVDQRRREQLITQQHKQPFNEAQLNEAVTAYRNWKHTKDFIVKEDYTERDKPQPPPLPKDIEAMQKYRAWHKAKREGSVTEAEKATVPEYQGKGSDSSYDGDDIRMRNLIASLRKRTPPGYSHSEVLHTALLNFDRGFQTQLERPGSSLRQH